MKRNIFLGVLLLSAIFAGSMVMNQVSAQKEGQGDDQSDRPSTSLLVEDFNYAAGALLTANNWTAHSGAGTNAVAVTAPGLTYTGYASSGVGNAVTLATSGEDVNRTFPVQATGSTYAACLVNLSDAFVDPSGGYFFHLGPDPISTTFRGRLYARKDANNAISFGITKAGVTLPTDIAFTPFSYSLNTTYLLVVKYTVVAGATNDTVSLIVNPVLPGTEPAPTVTAPDVAGGDIDPGSVAIRQGTATTAPTLRLDGIRVADSWADVIGGGVTPTPTPTPSPSPTPTPSPSPTPTPAAAPKFFFSTRMNGANEPTPTGSNGTGFGRVVLNAAETQITASFYWEGLTGNTTIGHIHTGAVGVNGPVTFDMVPPAGATRGSVVDKVFSVTPAQVASLRAGGMYFNVHSTSFGGGEIRGQLSSATSDAPLDFNGDGRTDFSVTRVTGSQVRWLNILNNTAATQNQVDFGINVDTLIPADYDGDGKDDIAVWRPEANNSIFYILQSTTNTLRTVRFGAVGDDPTLVADYDGDGIDDPAVFRKGDTDGAQSYFWWYGSFGTTKNVQVVVPWGVGADTGVPGDFNGDGKADFCVYRSTGTPARGVFFIHNGTGLFDAASVNDTQTRFGFAATDAVAPGDYDGDGRTDLAITRVEGAALAWYYLPSSGINGGATIRVGWGRAASDLEVQGDYDGDGKTDQAIWRTTAGSPSIYYILRSSDGNVQYQFWGLSTDTPNGNDTH